MAVIAGQRRTDNIASSQREIDLHKEILLLEPEAAPLTVITKQLYNGSRRRRAVDTLFSWHEDALEARSDQINNGAGYTGADTSIVVDNGTVFAVDDLVYVPRTGEVILVTAIATNTLTVVRGVGATSGAALVDNDPLYIIGTADQEGAQSQEARSENPVKVDNYTQIFKHSVEMSGSRRSAQNMSSPHDWLHQKRKTMIEHLKDIELAAIMGTVGENETPGAGAGPRRTTGGLLHFLTANNQDAGGTLTEATLESWLEKVFRYGSSTRTLFASPKVVSVLNAFARGKLQTFAGQENYGVKVMEWISPHGTVNIVKHNLLEVGVLANLAIAVDYQAEIAYRYLGGGPGGDRDTKYLQNRQENDRDGQKDEVLTECGFQVPEPKKHGVLKNVTG